MEFKSNMVLQDIEDGTLWLLDFSTVSRGQYGSGWVWTATSVTHNSRTGELKPKNSPEPRFIDSITDRDKYKIYAVAESRTRWYKNDEKTHRLEEEEKNEVLKKVMDKLTPAEREVMMKFARG